MANRGTFPEPQSENAGKDDSCQGCPNQEICATPPRCSDQESILIAARMATVKRKILVLSGKGGVGKSTFSAQLSYALAANDYQVGLLDVNICCPSIPTMLGLEGHDIHDPNHDWSPVYVKDNLRVISLGFMLPNPDEVIWNGPQKTLHIKQFLMNVNWGELDFLVVDTPPGASDEHLLLVQYLQATAVDGAIIVTTPEQISLIDARREINFCTKVGIRVLGVVENMSGLSQRLNDFKFLNPFAAAENRDVTELTLQYIEESASQLLNLVTHCEVFDNSGGGAMAVCQELRIPFLGKVPLDPHLARAVAEGRSCFDDPRCGASAIALTTIVECLFRRSITGMSDRLKDLPVELLLIQILSNLPLCQAIRAETVARYFCGLWKRVTKLLVTPTELRNVNPLELVAPVITSFIVDLSEGNHHLDLQLPVFVERYLCHLRTKQVQDIRIGHVASLRSLPFVLFNFQNLNSLCIGWPSFPVCLLMSSQLKQLKILKLGIGMHCFFGESWSGIERFIPLLPKLESLSLTCDNPTFYLPIKLKLASSSLMILKIRGVIFDHVREITMRLVLPSVEEVDISIQGNVNLIWESQKRPQKLRIITPANVLKYALEALIDLEFNEDGWARIDGYETRFYITVRNSTNDSSGHFYFRPRVTGSDVFKDKKLRIKELYDQLSDTEDNANVCFKNEVSHVNPDVPHGFTLVIQGIGGASRQLYTELHENNDEILEFPKIDAPFLKFIVTSFDLRQMVKHLRGEQTPLEVVIKDDDATVKAGGIIRAFKVTGSGLMERYAFQLSNAQLFQKAIELDAVLEVSFVRHPTENTLCMVLKFKFADLGYLEFFKAGSNMTDVVAKHQQCRDGTADEEEYEDEKAEQQ